MKSNTHTLAFNQALATVETFRHQYLKNPLTVQLPVQVIAQKLAVDLARILIFIQCQIKVSITEILNLTFNLLLEQICDYGLREATDGNYLVRYMKSSKSDEYSNLQHCWARFTCSAERHAEYKISSTFSLESGYDYLTLYGINNGQLTSMTDGFSNTGRWISLNDSNISIEFRTDGSGTRIGYDMEVRCMPN